MYRLICNFIGSIVFTISTFAGISTDNVMGVWSTDETHRTLLQEIDAQEDVLQSIRKGLIFLPKDSEARIYFTEALESSEETFFLLCNDASRKLKTNWDENVAWWILWYYANFVDGKGSRWTMLTRSLLTHDDDFLARIKEDFDSDDFEVIKSVSCIVLSGTVEELNLINRLKNVWSKVDN